MSDDSNLAKCPQCGCMIKFAKLTIHVDTRCPERPGAAEARAAQKHLQKQQAAAVKAAAQQRINSFALEEALRKMERTALAQLKHRLADAKAAGKSWAEGECVDCHSPIHVHVDWEDPLTLCRCCSAKRRVSRQNSQTALRIDEKVAAALRGSQLTGGWSVSGGAPGLGRRR